MGSEQAIILTMTDSSVFTRQYVYNNVFLDSKYFHAFQGIHYSFR